MKNANKIENGIAILNDLDKIKNNIKPAIKLKIAVRVPDWNIPQIIHKLMIKKNIFSRFILLVIAKIKNATDDAAALHP